MGLTGHLELTCGVDSRGTSAIRELSFRAPFHVSKPHRDQKALVVNVVNPTAGLLAGDQIRMDVEVETGGRLVLTTPSAARVYRTNAGSAVSVQSFFVGSSASLEVWPELFIPQAGAAYRQTTRISVRSGGELLFFESIAPGRVASGETFEYSRANGKRRSFTMARQSSGSVLF